jgi:DNA-directed RNA polymerase specialized sigma24 family protein
MIEGVRDQRAVGGPGENDLVTAPRAGDEAAFMSYVERHQGSLLRMATPYVLDRSVAEEAVQDAWLGGAARAGAVRRPFVAPRPGSRASS